MRQTPCRRQIRCSVQKIVTVPATMKTMTSGHDTKMDACKGQSSYWLRVTLLAVHMNAAKPLDLTLEVAPKARFDVVEMRSHFAAEHRALARYSHCLYWSSHTTAGFLDRSISARLRAQHVSTYVDAFRTLFPEGAGY